MKITSKTLERYVPIAYSNRELDADDQVVCHVSHPDSEEFEKYTGAKMEDFKVVDIVRDRVQRIENLEYGGQQILNGRDLIKKCKRVDVAELVRELAVLFMTGSGIPEESAKN